MKCYKYVAGDFEIKLGQRRKLFPSYGKSGAMAVLNTLVQTTRRSNGEGKRIFHSGGYSKLLQNSIVKASFSNNYKGGQWRAHARYLERVVAQGHAMGFDSQKDDIGLAKTMAAWQKAGDPHAYKFIISPEQGEKVDLKAHARALVRQMENDQGVQMEWCGIVHKNSGHPHIHIVVRGVSVAGQVLNIDRDYIKKGIRQRSRELLTQELGFRSKKDVLEARERSIHALRVTELDRILARAGTCSDKIKRGWLGSYSPVERDQMSRRLEFLVSHGLAVKHGKRYSINEDCLARLKEYQKEHDIAASLADERKHMLDPQLKVCNRQLKADEGVYGYVASVIYDEAKDKRYVLLETIHGEAIRVRMTAKMEQDRDQAHFQRGDFIYLEARDFENGGRKVRSYAYKNYKDILTQEVPDVLDRDITRLDWYYHHKRNELLEQSKTSDATWAQKLLVNAMEKRYSQYGQHMEIAADRGCTFEEMRQWNLNRGKGLRLSLRLER